MSGLSPSEREGCRNLLGLLDDDEIMALCDTVTNRLVQPEDRQGKDRPSRAAAPPQASPGFQVARAEACEAWPATRPGPRWGGTPGNVGHRHRCGPGTATQPPAAPQRRAPPWGRWSPCKGRCFQVLPIECYTQMVVSASI